MFRGETVSWLRIAIMTVTPMYQIDWIFRVVRIEISFWYCKKNSYKLKLRCNNHLSLQLIPELRETPLIRRPDNAPEVVPIECSWGAMVTFWCAGKPGAGIPKKIPRCTGKNQEQAPLYPLSALLITSVERCRQRHFAWTNSSGVENALYMSFQAHQVTIPYT
jgi:hypothetical protein